MHGQIIIKSVKPGEVVFCKTKTAEYWFLMMQNDLTNVYRRGAGKELCVFLGKRRLNTVLEEGKGFMMFGECGDPVAAIIPEEISKVALDAIPHQEPK